MNIPEFNEIIEPNDQTEARREHLEKLRELVGNVYPNKFDRTHITGAEDTITNILAFEPIIEIVKELKHNTPEGEKPNPELKEFLNGKLKGFGNVRVSGRLAVPPRVMGKAAFVHLSDGKERLQIYVRKQDALVISNDTGKTIEGEDAAWEVFKLLDHGDFIGAEGYLFLTNTGELSVHVETFQFLSKAMLPMPDKMHGIADPELRRRYRYADLIASSLQVEHEGLTTREVFERRAKLISGMRRFLDDAGYIEVETPMLTPKATGAAAKPFETHHNALDIPLYARIAPELYLKRLTVGGFEKVYELNRNFRNEGLSQRHNPEFTMLEFYCAYMDVNGMMDFAEEMIKESVRKANKGSLQVIIQEEFATNDEEKTKVINFEYFDRLSMKESIAQYWGKTMPIEMSRGKFNIKWLDDIYYVRYLATYLALKKSVNVHHLAFTPNLQMRKEGLLMSLNESSPISSLVKNIDKELIFVGKEFPKLAEELTEYFTKENSGQFPSEEDEKTKIVVDIFENVIERHLIQPTFIIDYPKSISPLSKASPTNPNIAERFELFINGMECANGFSELNDPREQYERFRDQMTEREKGDDEAMVLDEDYIRALSYGMPPAAGIGIGIDRLVMLLTNKHSIRDVILFPHMRPLQKDEGGGMKDE